LDPIVAERGQPLAIRCDNGPELTSRHFLAWCVERQIELVHIQPGKPTQNAHVESFHGRLREECLNVSWFQNLFDARRKITAERDKAAQHVNALDTAIRAVSGLNSTRVSHGPRKMSAAARARISALQKARWART